MARTPKQKGKRLPQSVYNNTRPDWLTEARWGSIITCAEVLPKSRRAAFLERVLWAIADIRRDLLPPLVPINRFDGPSRLTTEEDEEVSSPPPQSPETEEQWRDIYTEQQWSQINSCIAKVPARKRHKFLEQILDIAESYKFEANLHKRALKRNTTAEAARLQSLAKALEEASRVEDASNFLVMIRSSISKSVKGKGVPFPSGKLEKKVRQFREHHYARAVDHLISLLRVTADDLSRVRKQKRADYGKNITVVTPNMVIVPKAAILLELWSKATGLPVTLRREAGSGRPTGPSIKLLEAVFRPLRKSLGSYEAIYEQARATMDKAH